MIALGDLVPNRHVEVIGFPRDGVGDQVFFNDGGQILVVGDMFRQGHESHRRKDNRDLAYIGQGDALASLPKDPKEGEIRHIKEA